MKKLHKKKTKRVSLRQKHQIQKKATEAKRKLRREARRMAAQGIKKVTKKDPGIPNLCPNKKELLEDLQNQKKIEIDHKNEVRMKLKQQIQDNEFIQLRNVEPGYKTNNSLEGLLSSADIVLEVLDSRDPYPSPIISSLVGSKHHIYLLNKTDLVDEELVKQWKACLSSERKCFLFKVPPAETMKNEIIGHLKSYTPCIVAVVGYPNTGKSSIVNSLKGYKVASVTKLPGGTKKIEEYDIGDNIQLLDSPGIEIDDKSPAGKLRTTVAIENLQDPYTPVQGILEKVDKKQLLILYAIPDFKDIKEFLIHIAKKTGKTAKGGVPDFNYAAKIVLHDWFTMKIPYTTL